MPNVYIYIYNIMVFKHAIILEAQVFESYV